MNSADLAHLISALRTNGAESPDVEVKSAARGLPKSVPETVSAFSNGHGGTLILGLDESQNFAPALGFDPIRIRDALAGVCADNLEPPIRANIDISEFEGARLVIAEVPELAPQYKPCYVKTRGESAGSFIRTGDGDRKLTSYEIQLLHANQGQPRNDYEPVEGAGIGDLNAEEIEALLRRVTARQPQIFANLNEITVLRRLGVLADTSTPTLSGYLTLGTYPQQLFAQLSVSFVRVPGDSLATIPEGGPRFLDNANFDGPIPLMVEGALAAVARNMRLRSYVEGPGRVDSYEYPVEALREAIVNALIHRDYSPMARGSQVQIEMYANRLLVRSPGGLFGPVTQAELGGEGVSSSRNSLLVKLLADVRIPGSNRVVCENRASGIPTMIAQLRRFGLPAPEFSDRLTSFTVTFQQQPLRQSAATLPRYTPVIEHISSDESRSAVLAAFDSGKELSRREVQSVVGLSSAMTVRYLSELVESGQLVAIGAANSPRRRYRLA